MRQAAIVERLRIRLSKRAERKKEWCLVCGFASDLHSDRKNLVPLLFKFDTRQWTRRRSFRGPPLGDSEIPVMARTKQGILLGFINHGTGKMSTYLRVSHEFSRLTTDQDAGVIFSWIVKEQ